MGSLVSSRFDFLQKNVHAQVAPAEMEHELKHLKKREVVSGIIAAGTVALSILSLVGVMGGGLFILGALFAIATFAASYALCCRLAETGLKDKQMDWLSGTKPREGDQEGSEKLSLEKIKGFFSHHLGLV